MAIPSEKRRALAVDRRPLGACQGEGAKEKGTRRREEAGRASRRVYAGEMGWGYGMTSPKPLRRLGGKAFGRLIPKQSFDRPVAEI
ncbi:hypothetical protein PB2503_06277 [Parvularcula bermudensis HTCC2503]|uniref:Uncharacterized protein n=1 Tax=Parvularcula bermudensis (strain ATCC BAA-594 / HTCC2503 / KCTC 12087) TaxID=314260 RepID=E0THM5_PARBH|nr:hypothetical protein PB2503_06277 [Parvularcula bermudensis HTCC2503]